VDRMAAVRRVLVCVGVAVASLAAAAAALATSQTARSGAVSATYAVAGTFPQITGETLTIKRSGRVFYREPVTSHECGNLPCAPAFTPRHGSSISVLDLEHDGQPDVVLQLFTGGANCCFLAQVFSWDPGTMTYVKTERNFAYGGFAIKDLGHNGRFEFDSFNGDFIGSFTDVAASAAPIQILTFSGRRFHDVTRSYPALVAANAAAALKAFRSTAPRYADSVGVIAAWAADEDLLGNSAMVNSYLHQQAAAGHLNTPLSSVGEPSGTRFVAALQKFLRRLGYLA
jgi:hypothetical protein